MIVQLFKKIFDKISKFVAALLYRWERKNDNPHGYAMGGPKKMRAKLIIFVSLILGLAFATIFIKKGFYTSVEQNLDRETSPGAKLPTDLTTGIDKTDLQRLEGKSHDISSRVDCDRILANLRIRGTLSEREKIDFDRSCRDRVGKAMAEIIDKVLSGEVPKSVASEIMQTVTPKNADAVLNALNNEEVKKALRTDAGGVIARNIGNMGNLSDQQLSDAVKMIRAAPPQFRENLIDAVKSAAQLESPEAREALLHAVGKARSAEELKDVQSFAETIAKAKPDEQKVFAVAYEKAPDQDTRRALARSASEIVQLAQDDPVRAKLVGMVKQVSDLPPEQQKNAYNKIADVANAYRTTNDPDVKRGIGEAIMAAQSPNELVGLAKRLENLKDAEKAGPIEKDMRLAVIAGHDDEAVGKVRAAGELVRSGDMESAKKALSGKLEEDELQRILKKADDDSKNPFGANGTAPGADKPKEEISAQHLKDLEAEKINLGNKKKTLEAQILEYQRQGLEPGDSRMVDLYRELGATTDRLKTLSDSLVDVRYKLRQKLLDLKSRTKSEFEAAGIAMPDIDIKIPDDVVAHQAPEERLSNLRDVGEFWSSEDGSYKKRRRKYAKFNFVDVGGLGGDAGNTGDSILSKATKRGGDSWMMGAPGQGSQGGANTAAEFEMSRTLHIPGVIRRIPDGGISSKKVGTITVLFEFMGPVINRKTGRVEINVGDVAICKLKDFENDTGRLNAGCNLVDTGSRDDIRVNFSLGDAQGADGVPGEIVDNRGWYLAGAFLTAFSASVIDGYSQQVLAPVQQKAAKAATDFVVIGGGSGATSVLQQIAQKQVEEWQNGTTYWIGYDGMLATIRQN